MSKSNYRKFSLFLLTVVYGFNFIDRQIVGILAPFIQEDLNLSNSQLGLLIGLAFAAFYTLIAIPIAWLADRFNRVNILSISLATWSAFTALTGIAGSFLQIGIARMGVGIGEAGGSPSSHSIISDLYGKEERAGALGIYSMGIPIGIMAAYFVTASLIGESSEQVDWRRIFVVLGGVGIGLAGVVKLVLREPRRGGRDVSEGAIIPKSSFKNSIKTLLRIPTWWAMCLGIGFGSFVSYAFSAFQTKYLRILDPAFDFQTLLILLGIINGTTYVAGAYFGARITDKWGLSDIRAYGWVPAIAILVCLPIGVGSIWVASIAAHLVFVTFFLFFLGLYLGPCFAIAQTLAPINMRAMSTALFFFILNMIALGGGPTFTGWLIDVFHTGNTELYAMRQALTATCLFFIPSLISFLVVAKVLPRDWSIAEHRNRDIETLSNQ
ncbi:MFS transporter [Arenicella sp. 4NH20-0111]|uniref:spinster family MFS transporter n=1 Tax=Arenicella sp. 4NH20-0111 TaxID=3127648 RepID=UPI00310A5153